MIGVFDSGLGGLATLKDLMRELPGEDFCYYGDNAHAPYGTKPVEQIRALSFACTQFLLDKGCQVVVVACNTASSAAIDAMRAHFSVPFVAMEPAVRPAARLRKQGRILVLATQATLRQQLFQARIVECGIQQAVLPVPCPQWVELIEQGFLHTSQMEQAVQQALVPYRKERIDVIVLGCTHFAHIRPLIEREACSLWPQAQVIDGNEGTAHQLSRVLHRAHLRTGRTQGGAVQLYTSGDPAVYLPRMEALLHS